MESISDSGLREKIALVPDGVTVVDGRNRLSACLKANAIGLQAREHHEALRTARHRQKTKEFRSQYAARADIEGTHEQVSRRCGLR